VDGEWVEGGCVGAGGCLDGWWLVQSVVSVRLCVCKVGYPDCGFKEAQCVAD
jgi:hypothetical protein